MLSSDELDVDEFFDSEDSLSAQDSFLAKELASEWCGCDYEIWVNEPVSVRERRERFLQSMGLGYTSSNVCSQVGMERARECSGAVLNACISSAPQACENLVKPSSEAKVLFDRELKGCPQGDNTDAVHQGEMHELSFSANEHKDREAEAQEFQDFDMGKKRRKKWWKRCVDIRKGSEGKFRSKLNSGTKTTCRIKVRQNKKRWLEFSRVYIGQQIRAHKGLIWSMKFSPNGQYLASGGEDGVVRIWRVVSLETSGVCIGAEDSVASGVKHEKSSPWKKRSGQSSLVLPNKIFKIDKSPLQEFYGHSSDVLDLSWSNSDIILSSSMDKTVRLWQIGSNQCLSIFHHKDYVTCIQFNPVDEKYFISGSIDGKVRIWGIREERVTDWADIQDVISAISYQKDGKGFVVGSITGICRFYVTSGKYFQLEAQIHVHGKKKASGHKITGIQFSNKNSKRIMITSEDSKICIFDGIDLVQKYGGLPKSGSQISGSFTPSGKHIISVGDDSHVYIWNFNDLKNASSKQAKSEHSCEYFFSKGVTVAIPWPGMKPDPKSAKSNFSHCSSETQTQIEVAPPQFRELERFSLGSWFSSIDGSFRGSMTWPEEKLPRWDLPLAEDEYDQQQLSHNKESSASETWGVSIVVADCDGTIKTFHNFGLPVRL